MRGNTTSPPTVLLSSVAVGNGVLSEHEPELVPMTESARGVAVNCVR